MPTIEVSEKTLELLANWRKRFEQRTSEEIRDKVTHMNIFTEDFLIQQALLVLLHEQAAQ